MPLEPLQLDDLTWSDLTTAARDRIAGASRGQWTLHAPVDPGITLIELFASQLEQRLYWMSQPSTQLDEAILNLHGAHRKTVQCAKTVLSVFPQDGSASRSEVLPRHSVLVHSGSSIDRRFRTTKRINILPFECEQLINSGSRRQQRVTKRYLVKLLHKLELVDQPLSLNGSDCVPLFAPNQTCVSTSIQIPFCPKGVSQRLSKRAGKSVVISIFFDLDTPEKVASQWQRDTYSHPRIGPPTNISSRLILIQKGSSSKEVILNVISKFDGTNGFRNSGVMQFRVEPFEIDNGAIQPYLELRLTADMRKYTFVPRVKQIFPNAVIAENRQRLSQRRTVEFHRLPGNDLKLLLDADDSLIPDESLKVNLWEKPIGSTKAKQYAWRYVSSFTREGPQSRVFEADRDQGKIIFGNGLAGRIPVPIKGKELFVQYDVGGGVKGNLTARVNWTAETKQNRFDAINVVPATGGADAESVEDALRRFRSDLKKTSRAVTREDIENLAIETPGAGIARARALIGQHPDFPKVPTPGASSLFVVPDLPASLRIIVGQEIKEDLTALHPDLAAMRAVSRWLNTKRLLTQEIFVCQPEYEEVDLIVLLQGSPYDKEQTEREILKALREYLHPLLGGPDGKGWPFGGAIRPSELMRQLDPLIAPELRIVEVGIRKQHQTKQSCSCNDEEGQDHDHPSNEPQFVACKDTLIEDHSLVALRSIRIRYTAERRTGGLQ